MSDTGDTVHGNKFDLSGDYRGGQVFAGSTVNVDWQPPTPYDPPDPPPHDMLPDPGHLPPGSSLPYSRNSLFTGREGDLLKLAELLLTTAEEGSSGRPPSLVVITSGIGGVGKTQLAVEFAYRYGRFFQGVHWVSAENPDAVDAAVAECGRCMGLHPTFGALSLPDQVALTERAWAASPRRLVIFDNCEDEALLAARRPRWGVARLLVTSRRERWDDGAVALRPVRPLLRQESMALLRRQLTEGTGRPPRADVADDDLQAIAVELGELPLALRLAGSYLRRYRTEMVADYLAALRRAPLEHPSLRQEGLGTTGHVLDVGRTFAVSYARLQPADDLRDAAAVALLARAAHFAPGEPLPEELLLATLTTDPPTLATDGLERLLALGLLEGAGETSVRLHRLVGQFAVAEIGRQDAAAIDAARAMVEEAVEKALAKANASSDPRSLHDVIVHLRQIVDAVSDREDTTAALLCNRLGYYLRMSGDFAGARLYFERDVVISERILDPEHLDAARSLNNLGLLLKDMGDFIGAHPYLKHALAIWERVLGSDHPDTAGSLNNLGLLLQDMGDLAKARPYLERALAIRERRLGPEHPHTATSLNNLGSLLQDMGKLSEARLYFKRALAIRERVLGPEHPDTAASLNNLGMLLQSTGDLAGTRSYLERALSICERVLGPEHPYTATSLNNLGLLLQDMGDLTGARSHLERALTVNRRVLGPEHPNTAQSLNNLGSLLYTLGDLVEAQPYLEHALAIKERVFGPEHPDTAASLNNLGYLLRNMGDLAGARLYFERALTVNERILGLEHLNTAQSLNNLGSLLYSMGDLAGAQLYLERALAIKEVILGQEHLDTALSLNNLGALLVDLGQIQKAQPLLERALAIRMAKLGPDHSYTCSTLGWLSQIQ